ncbi:MAG TPA: hypothetical protein DCW72_02540 [Elusimicrobia bacterium]|nr:hypothetical protein [Elusimicrobiota bacterium]HAU89132.1 hypothetical protein [Elusimicrobiota bacterium]
MTYIMSALLCFFFLAPAAAGAEVISAAALERSFDIVVSPGELAAPPEVRTPSPAFSRGDFSSIPAYSFAYLNDLNTRMIDLSNRSVEAVIFSITLKDNPDALIRAKNRGARVRLIVDEAHVYPRADAQITRLMSEPGIELRTLRGTRSYGVNHNKILICDGAAVSAGSYNWTFGATFSNHENTLVAQHPVYLDGYARYFEWMWSKSRTPQQGPSAELPEGYYGAPPQDPSPQQSLNGRPVPAYLFSPGSRVEERLAELIDASRSSVDAVTFTFSSRILADAVVRAHRRGVRVRFLMDKNMGKTAGLAKLLFDSGVPLKWAGGRNEKGALHNKFLILDGEILQTGSFNWTVNANKNSFENLIFVSDADAVKAYQGTYDWLYNGAAAPSAGEFEAEPVE